VKAKECAERAEHARDPETKRQLEDLARQWLDLAKYADKDGGSYAIFKNETVGTNEPFALVLLNAIDNLGNSDHAAVSREITADDRFGASLPRRAASLLEVTG
jgi:hypothetical protein